MLVLGATSRRADWIRLQIQIRTKLRIELNGESPVVTQVALGICKILVGRDDIAIKLRSEVVVDIFGDIVPFGLGLFSSHIKLVGFHSFGKLKGSMAFIDIGVNSEVWNWVVDLVSTLLLLVLVLVATRG